MDKVIGKGGKSYEIFKSATDYSRWLAGPPERSKIARTIPMKVNLFVNHKHVTSSSSIVNILS